MIFSDAYLIFLFFQVSFHSLPGCPSHLSISLFASFRVSLAPSLTNFLLCLLLPLAWSHWFILLPSLLPCHVTLFILLPSQLPTRLHFFIMSHCLFSFHLSFLPSQLPSLLHFFIMSHCSSSFHLFFLPTSTSFSCNTVHPPSISSSYPLPILYQVTLFILLPSLLHTLL